MTRVPFVIGVVSVLLENGGNRGSSVRGVGAGVAMPRHVRRPASARDRRHFVLLLQTGERHGGHLEHAGPLRFPSLLASAILFYSLLFSLSLGFFYEGLFL